MKIINYIVFMRLYKEILEENKQLKEILGILKLGDKVDPNLLMLKKEIGKLKGKILLLEDKLTKQKYNNNEEWITQGNNDFPKNNTYITPHENMNH